MKSINFPNAQSVRHISYLILEIDLGVQIIATKDVNSLEDQKV